MKNHLNYQEYPWRKDWYGDYYQDTVLYLNGLQLRATRDADSESVYYEYRFNNYGRWQVIDKDILQEFPVMALIRSIVPNY